MGAGYDPYWISQKLPVNSVLSSSIKNPVHSQITVFSPWLSKGPATAYFPYEGVSC